MCPGHTSSHPDLITVAQNLPLPSTTTVQNETSHQHTLPYPDPLPSTAPHVAASVVSVPLPTTPRVTGYLAFPTFALTSWPRAITSHFLPTFAAESHIISYASNNLNATSVNFANLGVSNQPTGDGTTARGVPPPEITATPPSDDHQYNDSLDTGDSLGLLVLMLGVAVLLSRNAVLSHAAASSADTKSRGRLARDILFLVVTLLTLAVTAEAVGVLIAVRPRPTTQDTQDNRRTQWRKWVKVAARCLAVISLFLLLIGLVCVKSVSGAAAVPLTK